jgi:hypothetical protein
MTATQNDHKQPMLGLLLILLISGVVFCSCGDDARRESEAAEVRAAQTEADLIAEASRAAAADAEVPAALQLTSLFTNIDVKKLHDASKAFLDDVLMSGCQANTKPGTKGGYMTITPPGRKLQRFVLQGTISDEKVEELLSQLKADISALIAANGARVIGGEGASVKQRPIAYLPMLFPGNDPDLAYLRGFYFEYADEKGQGIVDVMASPIESKTDGKTWAIGFLIHEAAKAK